MNLRAEFNWEPRRKTFDVRLWERERPGKWIARVVWGREWHPRPKGWHPFQRDPGGYHKRGIGRSTFGPMAHFALGRFAAMVYRPDTARTWRR